MVYTLINCSALGFDVVRRPAAERLARVLLTALTAPPQVLHDLAATHPAAPSSPTRQREALAAAALMRSTRTASGTLDRHVPDQTAEDLLSWPEVGRQVAEFSLGGPDKLDRFIAAELLGPDSAAAGTPTPVRWLAADLMAEAAVTAWTAQTTEDTGADTADGGPAQSAESALDRVLTVRGMPTEVDLGPHADRVHALLADLPRALHASNRTEPPARQSSGRHGWAQAMHEAAWAAHLSGRTRPAMAAQLLTAYRLATSGLSTTDLAGWAWNAASAAVTATVVGDLLTTQTTDTLLDYSGLAPS